MDNVVPKSFSFFSPLNETIKNGIIDMTACMLPQISRFYGDTVVTTDNTAVTIIIDGDNDGQRYLCSYFYKLHTSSLTLHRAVYIAI